jgi:hypothetical protein
VTSRTPQSPAPELVPTAGASGRAAFDVAATLRRIEAVLATLEGARIEAEKQVVAPAPRQKRMSFDWG